MPTDTRPAILEWMRENVTEGFAKGMLYRQAAIDQMHFFRDRVATLFLPRDAEPTERDAFCKIESWHTSKSIDLPVYYFHTGIVEVVARDNFYNWNVTVGCTRELELPTYFDIDGGFNYLFMEGMEQWRRSPYRDNRREFSFCVWDKYVLFAVMMCIASQTKPT